MVSYFSKDLEQNKANNDVNKVSNVKLLQGDLAEAWREGETDYASVAMRFSLVDKTLERATGRLVSGSETPIEVTEVWTFARQRGANWELSAIQQTNGAPARRRLKGAAVHSAAPFAFVTGIMVVATG